MRKTWASDPRLLRFSVVKMGEKLGEIASVGGKAEEWAHAHGSEGSTGLTFEEEREGHVMNAVREVGGVRHMGGGQYQFPGAR